MLARQIVAAGAPSLQAAQLRAQWASEWANSAYAAHQAAQVAAAWLCQLSQREDSEDIWALAKKALRLADVIEGELHAATAAARRAQAAYILASRGGACHA